MRPMTRQPLDGEGTGSRGTPGAWTAAAALVLLLLGAAPVDAAPPVTAAIELGGRVHDVRLADANGDGRGDLAAIIDDGRGGLRVVLFRGGPTPATRTWFPADARAEIRLDGPLARTGMIAFARFGDAALRVFHPGGCAEFALDGRHLLDRALPAAPSIVGAPGVAPTFLDGVADLDGDGRPECWIPIDSGEGAFLVRAGDGRDLTLALSATSRVAAQRDQAFQRVASIPSLTATDLDGDGRLELATVVEGHLVGFDPLAPSPSDGAPDRRGEPVLRLPLPFLLDAPPPAPNTLHMPRIQLEDVDGDGAADLIVTLITGRTDRLGSLKTILFHYAGPLRAPERTELGTPRGRIDTPSVVLHPVFTDLDGDGALDYAGDSIRDANLVGLAARMLGKDPPLTLEAFRFDRAAGTFATTPHWRTERLYPGSEALGNRFRANAYFGGDLDGDGRRDLVDLGNLTTATVLAESAAAAGASAPRSFDRTIVGPLPVPGGLEPAARFGDLNGDGRPDVALFGGANVYLLVGGAAR